MRLTSRMRKTGIRTSKRPVRPSIAAAMRREFGTCLLAMSLLAFPAADGMCYAGGRTPNDKPSRDAGASSAAPVRAVKPYAGQAALLIHVDHAIQFQLNPSGGPVESVRFTSSGAAPPNTAAGCAGSTIVTHTDGNFDGGQFIIQQGFAENEIFAAQYLIPPDQFPITIRQINFIIAQQAIVTTTTHYTVFIWDGEPGGIGPNSVEMARFNSMEDLAPVIMQGGGIPRGTNVQLFFDQGDPNQLVISNTTGTNAFSVGIRIDAHNAPPPDPCNPTPDSLVRNAFPAVDVSGVSTLTGNWVFALTCPGGLCPSGWLQFADLGNCRPSGDWFIKATYECAFAPSFGACCDPAGTCLDDVANFVCEQFGPDATFFEGEVCANVTCPAPTGACCAFGTCLSGQTLLQCDANGGTYLGDATDCTNSPCVAGACCMPDGSCSDLIQPLCAAAGGTFDGPGTDCASTNCPQPGGACCFGEVCVDNQQQTTCEVSGVWLGPDTTCVGSPCSTGCPTASISSSDPPDLTVDARQPHAPGAALPRTGIGSIDEPILIQLGAGGAESCFSLCETAADPLLGANDIDTVVDLGGGVYELTLLHAITAGAVTTVQYNGDASFVAFTSHPGNADADSAAGPSDVLAIIDGLNGVAIPPYGLYSSDIDKSGTAGPEDILRVIDLLNGAATFDAWLDSPLPANATCP